MNIKNHLSTLRNTFEEESAMRSRIGLTTAAIVVAAVLASGCGAAETTQASPGSAVPDPQTLRVVSAMGMKSVLDEIAGEFRVDSGVQLDVEYDTAGLVRDRIAEGERADVVLAPRPLIDDLLRKEAVDGNTITDLSRSLIGVAASKGAPTADISTPHALKTFILNAESLSYTDPADGGLSGTQFAKVLGELGVAEEVASKTRLGNPMDRVETGEVQYSVIQMTEINSLKNVELVGLLPEKFQVKTPVAIALTTNNPEKDAGEKLINFLSSPHVSEVFREKGMTPLHD